MRANNVTPGVSVAFSGALTHGKRVQRSTLGKEIWLRFNVILDIHVMIS